MFNILLTATTSERAFAVMVLSAISLLSCQLVKGFVFFFKDKSFNINMFFTTGGFPSSHTSTVITMITSIAIFQIHDTKSIDYVLAVACVVAVIIIHDAMGVRYEASKHARILNKMVENESIEKKQKLGFGHSGILKELLGHKKIEVLAGFIYGILVAVIGCLIVL